MLESVHVALGGRGKGAGETTYHRAYVEHPSDRRGGNRVVGKMHVLFVLTRKKLIMTTVVTRSISPSRERRRKVSIETRPAASFFRARRPSPPFAPRLRMLIKTIPLPCSHISWHPMKSFSRALSLAHSPTPPPVGRLPTPQPAERIVREGHGPRSPSCSFRPNTSPGGVGGGRTESRSRPHCTPQGFQATAGDRGCSSILQGVPGAMGPLGGPRRNAKGKLDVS